MININCKTEYSFKQCYGFVDDIVKIAAERNLSHIGITDINGTYGHASLEQSCKKYSIKPIFGTTVTVFKEIKDRTNGSNYILIAKNNDGLEELNKIVSKCWGQFYYVPRISKLDLMQISDDIIVISDGLEIYDRTNYLGISPRTPKYYVRDIEIPPVALSMNRYPKCEDKGIYQIIAGSTKRGDGYIANFEGSIYPQHILSEVEWRFWCGNHKKAIENTHIIAEQCSAKLRTASNVKYRGENKKSLRELCVDGAKKLGINLSKQKNYADRLKREIKIIESKDFTDYFLIVADLIEYAKVRSFVGPGRGSSAGSIVCYFTGITTVDPIQYDLLFERFIDENRDDLPDIDIDFTDTIRDEVIQHLIDTYGPEKVAHIANINRLKPKSAIGLFAQGMKIPIGDTEKIKDAIISRSSGDARAALTMTDTFESTDVGVEFIEKYPEMKITGRVQNHASHTGVHAAGIIVSDDEIAKYIGVNARLNMIMGDKKYASYVNLLKIDCLGLRTLSVLEECAKLANFDVREFYDIKTEDQDAFKLFNEMRLFGIFQFEGQALQYVTRNMGVTKFDDIVAITALARPGPMHSGGTNKFIERRTGREKVEYISDHDVYVDVTKDTYGIVVYQEQLMRIAKEYGLLSWEDVQNLRRGAARSAGLEYFNKYKEKFLIGANKLGRSKEEASEVWENIVTFGSWAFNKSHALCYGLISYWTAWAKAHYPLEFTVANLRHSKSPESAIRILRDAVKNEGYEYIPCDPEISEVDWSVQNNVIVGGFCNIDGIGRKKADQLVRKRNGGRPYTKSEIKALWVGTTPYDILYPTEHHWGFIKQNHKKYKLPKVQDINTINGEGFYTVIGKLLHKDIMDLNEYNTRAKRGGEFITEHSLYLKILLEDDTDQIQCRINRFKYDELKGKHIAETAIDGETWLLIQGRIRGDWRAIDITAIYDLTRDENNIFNSA